MANPFKEFRYFNVKNTSETEFKIDRLLRETRQETTAAENDFAKMKQEVSVFLESINAKNHKNEYCH